MRGPCVALLLFACLVAARNAWGVEVSGTVVDDQSRAPVAGADVIVSSSTTQWRLATDEAGRFVVDVPAGRARIRLLSLDHQALTAEVEVAEGMEPLQLSLISATYDEVVVLYYEDPDPVVTKRSVTSAEVARVPGAFGDPVRVITSLPGAARPPFGSSQVIIRGGNDDDTTVFIDGVEVPIVYHVLGYRSVVHPSMVAEVDFLPGVFPSRYGDTTSGVIDIQTRADWSDQWETTAQVDLLDASASVRGTVADTVGVAASVRRSYIDAILSATSNDFVLPRWFDYQLQLQTLWDSPHTLRLVVFGLDDRLGVEGSDFGITTSTGSHRGVASWVYEPTGRFKLLVQPSVGWDDDRFGVTTAASVVERGLRLGLRSEARWTPNPHWVVVGGVQVQSSNLELQASLPFDPAGPGGSAFETADARWVAQPDPYVEVQLRPAMPRGQLVVNAGVRAESMWREGLDPELGVSPRGSVRWDLGRGVTLKAGAGMAHQMPSTQALAFSADTQLALERAYTAEVGWEQALGRIATFDAVVYGRQMERIATQQFGAPSFDNDGIGRAYGLELLLRKVPEGRLFGWVSYSLSRSERISDPQTSDDWLLYDLDQPHNLIAVAGYDIGKGWDLGARFQFTSGNPYTPYDGAVFELSDGTYTGTLADQVNSARLSPYAALDLRISKTWTSRNGEARIYLDLLNVVQGENPEFLLDAYDFSETAAVTSLPFLPSPGIQLDWRF
ncbi:MAG: TonB-dependent receptor [Myxococcales bacterium]|nr:TonB-dependent receptor [Myxococcales bacterium]